MTEPESSSANQQFLVGSLFSGIGGLDLGLERAGMQITWQSEIDPYASAVLRKHWPGVPNLGDIRNITRDDSNSIGSRFGEIQDVGQFAAQAGEFAQYHSRGLCGHGVDLICGGFPCQPFSVAGKRRGHEDDRFLWPEMLRVVKEFQPRWFLGENVPGIINMALDQVFSDLEALGYETGAVVVPACALDAPHRRDRVWIVACAVNGGSQERRPCNIRQVGRGVKERQATGYLSTKIAQPSGDVADSKKLLRDGGEHHAGSHRECGQEIPEPGDAGGAVHNMGGIGGGTAARGWDAEPSVGRVAHGVPSRVDRLKCLGNAVVPQVAEALGRMILAVELGEKALEAL